MDDVFEDLFNEEPQRTGPTGPRTPGGKIRSSRNSLKHGCRSEKSVLPHEDPAEFEATAQHWFAQYAPETTAVITLVENLARAHWQLKRNQKRPDQTEWQLPDDVHQWTEEHHKRLALFTRYHTTAERSFLRYFKEIEAYYHRMHRDEQARQLAFAKLSLLEFKRLEKSDEAAIEHLRIEQAVEVVVEDGVCQSDCYPPNEEVLETAAQRRIPPIYISRCILFPNGTIPAEYAWVKPAPMRPGQTPRITQHILWEHWLQLIEHEKSAGLVGPLR